MESGVSSKNSRDVSYEVGIRGFNFHTLQSNSFLRSYQVVLTFTYQVKGQSKVRITSWCFCKGICKMFLHARLAHDYHSPDPWAEKKVMPGVWWESDAPLGVLWNVTWLKYGAPIQKGIPSQTGWLVKDLETAWFYYTQCHGRLESKATGFLFVYVGSFFQIQISY